MFQSRKCADLQDYMERAQCGLGRERFWPSERDASSQYLGRRRRGYSAGVYPRHVQVARGLCPGPRVHVLSDGDGVGAKGRETLDKSAQVVLAGGKTPPPQIRRRGTRWAGQVLLGELGTHETRCEELSAGKISCRRRNMVMVRVQGSWIYGPACKTGSRQASRGRPSEQASQPASQPGLSRRPPGAGSNRAQKGGRVWTAYCRNRLVGLSRSRHEFPSNTLAVYLSPSLPSLARSRLTLCP